MVRGKSYQPLRRSSSEGEGVESLNRGQDSEDRHSGPRRRRPGRRSRWFSRLALLAAGGLFGLFLAELFLRAYFAWAPVPPDSHFIPDPEAHYRLRPTPAGAIEDPADHINAFGFRGREHLREKPPGTYRILGIGDSFVYGLVPMRANFMTVAERQANDLLSAGAGPRDTIEVIPMGLPGYSPKNYVGVLRSIGLATDPDLVVVGFFIDNDVIGIPVRGEVLHGELYYVGSSTWWLDLLRRLRLWVVAEKVMRPRVNGGHRQASGREPADGEPLSAGDEPPAGETPTEPVEPTLAYLLYQWKRLPVYAAAPNEEIEALWKQAEGSLLEIDRLCARAGIDWILMLIPAEIQVDEGVRAAVLRKLERPASVYDFEAPQRRLRELAANLDVPVLDLLPRFRELYAGGERLYFPNDTHWNPRGNRVAGEMLAHELIARAAGAQSAGEAVRSAPLLP